MALTDKKKNALVALQAQLGIKDSEFDESFVRGSGKGGQKQNKTANCVVLVHTPSGKRVKCQKDRSREVNRFLAKRQILEALADEFGLAQSPKSKEIEKIQKRKQRKKRRQKTDTSSTQVS